MSNSIDNYYIIHLGIKDTRIFRAKKNRKEIYFNSASKPIGLAIENLLNATKI